MAEGVQITALIAESRPALGNLVLLLPSGEEVVIGSGPVIDCPDHVFINDQRFEVDFRGAR